MAWRRQQIHFSYLTLEPAVLSRNHLVLVNASLLLATPRYRRMTQTAMQAPSTAPTPSAPSQMRGSKGTMRIATNPPKAPHRIPIRIVPKARLMPTFMPKPLSLCIGRGCQDCSVHRVAADFSTGALCAEKSLTCQAFDVVRYRGMVMIYVARELPNADA